MKIETIAQAKANARVAHDHYQDLCRMQKRLAIEVPEARGEMEAAQAIVLRLSAQRGSECRREAELAALKSQLDAAKSGAELAPQNEPANRADALDIFVAELAGA